jgi:hypothetical protein
MHIPDAMCLCSLIQTNRTTSSIIKRDPSFKVTWLLRHRPKRCLEMAVCKDDEILLRDLARSPLLSPEASSLAYVKAVEKGRVSMMWLLFRLFPAVLDVSPDPVIYMLAGRWRQRGRQDVTRALTEMIASKEKNAKKRKRDESSVVACHRNRL